MGFMGVARHRRVIRAIMVIRAISGDMSRTWRWFVGWVIRVTRATYAGSGGFRTND